MGENSALTHELVRLKHALLTKHLSGADERVDAVVAVLLREDHRSGLHVLLIHRAERIDDPWSGQIGFPGGRVSAVDSSPRAALRREVKEEIGIDIDQGGKELGTLSVGSPMRQLDLRVQPWVYAIIGSPEISIGYEIQEAFWASVLQLPSLRTSTDIEIRGTRRAVDAFVVNGHVVWGYTHRVLSELLSLDNFQQ